MAVQAYGAAAADTRAHVRSASIRTQQRAVSQEQVGDKLQRSVPLPFSVPPLHKQAIADVGTLAAGS